MAGSDDPTATLGRPGLSRTATVIIAASSLVLAAGVAVTEYALNKASKEQTSELEQRIAKAEARIEGLTAALAASESRLRRAESVVAVDQSEAAARKAEREELNSSPGKYIQSLEVTVSRRGLINTYSRALAARLRNASHFNVSEMRGIVEYRRANGALVGSAPLQITGTLLAGQTATLPVSAGEVTGASIGTNSKVIIQSLTILGGN
jgi:hypothetical protein